MSFIELANQYGLAVVLSGILASIICGMIKVPIVHKIKSLGLSDKDTSNRIKNVCTTIVALLSVILVVTYHCVVARSFRVLLTTKVYSDILLAVAFSKIAYMLYEGFGSVSIKKGLHIIWDKISNKAKSLPIESKDDIRDWVEMTQSILLEQLHLPLTDLQKETLVSQLRECKK